MSLSTSGSKIVNPFRFLEVFETWGPYIDGDLIKEQAVSAFLKGHWQKEKPVLLGKHKHTNKEQNIRGENCAFHVYSTGCTNSQYMTNKGSFLYSYY